MYVTDSIWSPDEIHYFSFQECMYVIMTQKPIAMPNVLQNTYPIDKIDDYSILGQPEPIVWHMVINLRDL